MNSIYSQKNCFECHATGLRFPPQFLIGQEAEVEEKIRLIRNKMIFKLSNQMMPPSADARAQMKENGDLDTILNYLKSLK
jgi:mono/diheme cytochrome c family protein